MRFHIPFKGLFPEKSPFDIEKILAENRFYPRIECEIGVTYAGAKDSAARGTIIEISPDGIRLACTRRLMKGDCIMVEPCGQNAALWGIQHRFNAIDTEVIWCRKRRFRPDYTAGLQYTDEKEKLEDSFVAAMFKKYGIDAGLSRQRRRSIRIEAALPVIVKLKSRFIEGVVKDIGIGGMAIEMPEKLKPGSVEGYRVGPFHHLKPLHTFGEIAYSRPVPGQKSWEYGVIFVDMTDLRTSLLNSYIVALLLGK